VEISQGKAVEVTVKNKEENSSDFCMDFVQEFCLRAHFYAPVMVPLTLWGDAVMTPPKDTISYLIDNLS
jgi:hypothetical protein